MAKTFIAAGEESYGYMVGDFVRDKDAVSACAFFAALAAAAKMKATRFMIGLFKCMWTMAITKRGLLM